MNLREWLIVKLGGYLMPEPGHIRILNNNGTEEAIKNMILGYGGVPLPKASDGQYIRLPSVCKNPVRKGKQTETPIEV